MLLDKLFILVLVICFMSDITVQKIYNIVIFPALAAAMILHFFYFGLHGLEAALLGFGVGFVILLIPYCLGGIGAGDVKLLALIGAIKGWIFVLNTALYMSIIGGIIALGIILCHKPFVTLLKEIGIKLYSQLYGIRVKFDGVQLSLSKKYPYGVAIVGGAFICLYVKGASIL